MTRLAILGASGHGKVVADCAELVGWQTIDFYDDAWPSRKMNGHWQVVGDSECLFADVNRYQGVLVAIGDNRIRMLKMLQFSSLNAPIVTLIHPSATVSRYTTIGPGSVILAGAVLNAGVSVGGGAIINTAASVDHDCVLGECVHISPGARLAGGVQIGDRASIGIGACIKQNKVISADVIVGAGAAVVKDVSPGQTVVGVPAKPL